MDLPNSFFVKKNLDCENKTIRISFNGKVIDPPIYNNQEVTVITYTMYDSCTNKIITEWEEEKKK